MTLTDTTKNLKTKCLVQHIDLNEDVFFGKDLDRKHFFEKYSHVELSTMKKRFRKKPQKTNVKLYLFNFFFSKITWADKTFRQKL